MTLGEEGEEGEEREEREERGGRVIIMTTYS